MDPMVVCTWRQNSKRTALHNLERSGRMTIVCSRCRKIVRSKGLSSFYALSFQHERTELDGENVAKTYTSESDFLCGNCAQEFLKWLKKDPMTNTFATSVATIVSGDPIVITVDSDPHAATFSPSEIHIKAGRA